jgi:hypothetical protein
MLAALRDMIAEFPGQNQTMTEAQKRAWFQARSVLGKLVGG